MTDRQFCDATLQRVTVEGTIAAATILPHVGGYPADKLELLAPVPVMETLGLALGQTISVEAE